MSSNQEILLEIRYDDEYAVFLHEIVPAREVVRTSFRVRVVSMVNNDVVHEQILDDESWGKAIFEEQVDRFIPRQGVVASEEDMPQAADTPIYTSNPLFGRF